MGRGMMFEKVRYKLFVDFELLKYKELLSGPLSRQIWTFSLHQRYLSILATIGQTRHLGKNE